MQQSYEEEQAYIPNDLGRGPMVTIQHGQYNMDLDTLLFIARQGRGEKEQASKICKMLHKVLVTIATITIIGWGIVQPLDSLDQLKPIYQSWLWLGIVLNVGLRI